MFKCVEQQIKKEKQLQHHQKELGNYSLFNQFIGSTKFINNTHLCDICSLLSTNRDSTYREDDPKSMDDFNSNGTRTIAKSSSCSSFLIDILFRGIGFMNKIIHFKWCVIIINPNGMHQCFVI